MAAKKEGPAKGGRAKKGLRGKMPTKRSINLILVDENKIRWTTAIPAIILILLLAALFSKYLVYDRLIAMSVSGSRVAQMKSDLDKATDALNDYGDVETTYAHYTYAGMTQAELNLVDRSQVLELVSTVLPPEPSWETVQQFLTAIIDVLEEYRGSAVTLDEVNARIIALLREYFPPRYDVTSWSVSENLLTIEVGGNTLRTLNTLARELEHSPIVDNCAIVTANRDREVEVGGVVRARLLVYLQQAQEEASAS